MTIRNDDSSRSLLLLVAGAKGAVASTMARLGYQGDISLELYPYVNIPEEAGRQSLSYLQPILQDSGLKID